MNDLVRPCRRAVWSAGSLSVCLALAGCGGGGGGAAPAAPAASVALPLTAQETPSLMPLGDSLTAGYAPNNDAPGGYRLELYKRLNENGIKVRFVGSQSNGPAALPEKHHEGHIGWRIDQIAAVVDARLKADKPQIVLLLIGTNDVIQRDDLGGAPARLQALIERIARNDPAAYVLVGSLPVLGDPARQALADTYNAALAGVVATEAAAGRRVHEVDLSQAVTGADLEDGIHPNAAGYAKLGDAWYNALLHM